MKKNSKSSVLAGVADYVKELQVQYNALLFEDQASALSTCFQHSIRSKYAF